MNWFSFDERIAGCVRRATMPFTAWSVLLLFAFSQSSANEQAEAKRILDVAEIQSGLIVHVGCDDGELTAALAAASRAVVQGVDDDPSDVATARRTIREQGISGRATAALFDGRRLPFADNLVTLLVAESLGKVPRDEAMRVLSPRGTLLIRKGDGWSALRKPRDERMDDWTHYLYDASGNPVAHDQLVGPPSQVRWIAGPRHTRSHEHTPTINAVVSANGRIFYIEDEAPVASILRSPSWVLVARDAFNGVVLWKRPLESWYPSIVNWGTTPKDLQRRLVATGDRVFVTLGLHSPVYCLDAANGETLKEYDGTLGVEEILYIDGVLLLAAREVTRERLEQLVQWSRLARQEDSPLFTREKAQPLVNRWRSIESRAPRKLMAVDADSGQLLWKKTGSDVSGLRSLTLCAAQGRAYYQRGDEVVCLDLKSGETVWTTQAGSLRSVSGGRLFCVGRDQVTALAADTGKRLWSQKPLLVDVRDLFVANGSLWLGGFKPCPGKRSPAWGPYFVTQRDLATGEVLRHIEPENPSHHHRCYVNKATDRYILGGRRGIEMFDLKTGDLRWHSWVRGVCKYGIMPANGLIYAPPHACACYIAAKLDGFYALAATRDSPVEFPPPESPLPLTKGPAYDAPLTNPEELSVQWPTYRHDGRRSGTSRTVVPARLKVRWMSQLDTSLSSPVVAGGRVFVAAVDDHEIVSLDDTTGETVWRFGAGARIDSPPTYDRGRIVFGSHDGNLYNVRADDGALAWSRPLRPKDRRIVVQGQVESVWPVHGSVLVEDGIAYPLAGRSSYLDGGMALYRIDVAKGEVLGRTSIFSPDPKTGKQPPQSGPADMPGSLTDLLSTDHDYVYLRDSVFDRGGGAQEVESDHLFTLTGFLDDSWPHRSYWIFGTRCSIACGCAGRDRNLIYGRLLAFDDEIIFGYGRKGVHWSNQLEDGPYRVFAIDRGSRETRWEKRVPLRVRALVKAGNFVFVAGRAGQELTVEQPQDAPSLLLALNAETGDEVARLTLDDSPVFDGMAAAQGRLYITGNRGTMMCLEGID